MIKLFVFSLSCIVFLSGCNNKKSAPSDRMNRARDLKAQKAAQQSQSASPTNSAGNQTSNDPESSSNTGTSVGSGSSGSTKPGDTARGSGSGSGSAKSTSSGNDTLDDLFGSASTPGGSATTSAGNSSAGGTSTEADTSSKDGKSNSATAQKAGQAGSTGNQNTAGLNSESGNQTSPPAETAPVTAQSAAASASALTPGAKPDSSQSSGNDSAIAAKAGDDKEDLVQLTFEETKSLNLILKSQFHPDSLKVLLQPKVPSNLNGEDLSLDVKGNYEKLTFAVKNKEDILAEFKDVKLELSNQTKLKAKDYSFLGICIGQKCEVVFVSVYRAVDKTLTENYPAILKWTNNRYLPAQAMGSAEIQERLAADQSKATTPEEAQKIANEQIAKAPPQLRVKYLLEANYSKYFPSLVTRLDARMKKDNSIYAGYFFPDVKTGSFDWILKRQPKGLDLELKIEFVDSAKRDTILFKGLVPDKGARLTDKSGMTLDVYHVIKNELFVMVFETQKFVSPLPDSKRAIQAHLCQVLYEDNQSFSECEPMSSSYVLGEAVQEGRIGGPALERIGDDGKPIIIEKYTPRSYEDMKSNYSGKK